MTRVSLFDCCFIHFLQKIYNATRKFHLPRILQQICYKIYFNFFQYVLDPYLDKALNYSKQINYKGNYNSNIIWIFWWQGYNHMPLIVKRCITSVKEHSNGHKVILITKDNIKKYTTIPNYIYSKVDKRCITLTHLSDILRFNLLNNYGGLWCDATMYCSSNLDKHYFNYLYTSGGYIGTPPKFVAGRWTGFLIGGNQHNALFQFMCNYFNLYWKYNKYQIAYFLIDLGLHYAYVHNIGGFKTYADNVACHHNPDMFKLADLLNERYNINTFTRITKSTNMFKLTYKKKFIKGNTFYNKLINKK